MSTPTPGPWSTDTAGCARVVVVHHGPWSEIIADVFAYPHDARNRNANARLMAAAPDLLAALQEAVTAYGKPGGPWNVPSDPGGWLERARTAIAKAQGGEP